MKRRLIIFFYSALIICAGLSACQSEEELNYARYFVNGKGLYEQHCENCHGKQGQGLGALIPSLSDTSFLKQNRLRLACIVKYGLSEQITVNKVVFEGKMPDVDHLANIDIAQVITFITNSFGNKQGLYDADEVTRNLKNCR